MNRPPTELTRRSLLVAGGALSLGVLLSSCTATKSSTSTPNSSTPQTLSLATPGGAVADLFTAGTSEYHKLHPAIKTELNLQSNPANYKAIGPQLFASDNAPDLAYYWNEQQSGYNLAAENNVLEPLDDIWAETQLASNIPKSSSARYRSPDGHYYSVPTTALVYGMVFYNKTLFGKAGIQNVPAVPTFEQLTEWTQRLQKANIPAFQTGAKDPGAVGWLYNIYLQREMGNSDYATLSKYATPGESGKINYLDERNIAALNDIARLQKVGFVDKSDLALTMLQAISNFQAGKVAMLGNLSSAIAGLDGSLHTDYGYFVHPKMQPTIDPSWMLYDGNALVVPKKSPHLATSKDVVKYFASQAGVNYLTANQKTLFIRNVSASTIQSSLSHQYLGIESGLKAQGSVFPWASQNVGSLVQPVLSALQGLLAGSMTPRQIAQSQQGIATGLRSKGRATSKG